MAMPADDSRRHRPHGVESALAPVLGAVFPVFGLVACGVLAGRYGLVHQSSSHALNQFVYAFALPAMLFIAVYRGSLSDILSGYFMLAVVAGALLTPPLRYVVLGPTRQTGK